MPTVNNVKVDAMRDFVATIQADAAQARKTKHVEAEWQFGDGGPQVVSRLEFPTGHLDAGAELPPFAGGYGTNPDPIQYCVHGMAACFAVTFAATAAAEGIELTRLKVVGEMDMDLRKQMGVGADDIIRAVRLRVEAAGPDRATLERLFELSEQRCPGTEAARRSLPLDARLV